MGEHTQVTCVLLKVYVDECGSRFMDEGSLLALWGLVDDGVVKSVERTAKESDLHA